MLTADALLGAPPSLFKAAPPLAHYAYDTDASDDRCSSDENYDTYGSELGNACARSPAGASPSGTSLRPPGSTACASWIPAFLAASYFQPCERHRHHKKNESTFFCVSCGAKPQSVCQHCMGAHAGHQVIQVRRYVYCDVVRACDINAYVDTTGVQNYIINSAKVVFLNHRPHSKIGRAHGVDTCRSCHRHLREGYSYCSLACKVEALTKGDIGGSATSIPAAAPAATAAAATPTVAAVNACGGANLCRVSSAGACLPAAAPPLGHAGSDAAGCGGGVTGLPAPAAAARPQPTSPACAAAVSAAAAASPFAAETSAATAASCAALMSDHESSDPEPVEEPFAFGGARSAAAAVVPFGSGPVPRRRTTVPSYVRERTVADAYGSGASSEEECYEYNFENPPKRRRSAVIPRRPSCHSGYGALATGGPAALAAVTLLMQHRSRCVPMSARPAADAAAAATSSGGAATSSGSDAAAVTSSMYSHGSMPAAPELSVAAATTAAAAVAAATVDAAAMSSRRKRSNPQRAPSL